MNNNGQDMQAVYYHKDSGVVDTTVTRAQDGDREAFKALYQANVGRVYALSLRLTGDPVRAEELTQDVFVQAWERLHTYRGEGRFAGWLRKMTVNLALQERRSAMRREMRVMVTDNLEAFERPVMPSPEQRIDLERAIATLPEGARTVLVLHDVEGYRHQEIAELTGVAIGTCKAQLHRARRLLRERLER